MSKIVNKTYTYGHLLQYPSVNYSLISTSSLLETLKCYSRKYLVNKMLLLSNILSQRWLFWYYCISAYIFQIENHVLISANLPYRKISSARKKNQRKKCFWDFLMTIFLTSLQAASESRLQVKYIRLVGTLVLYKITCSCSPWGFCIKAAISIPLFLQLMAINAWIFPCLIRKKTHIPSLGTWACYYNEDAWKLLFILKITNKRITLWVKFLSVYSGLAPLIWLLYTFQKSL